MAQTIKAWQCIGCGRLESDAPCLGICEDRTPREGKWEKSYLALQNEARALLGQ